MVEQKKISTHACSLPPVPRFGRLSLGAGALAAVAQVSNPILLPNLPPRKHKSELQLLTMPMFAKTRRAGEAVRYG